MAKLISTVKFPVVVAYGEESIVVSPGEKLKIKDVGLLPAELPAGLVLIKD